MRRWKAHRGKIASLSFSRDGQFLASVTGSGRDIFIWDATGGGLARKLEPGEPTRQPFYGGVSAAVFSKDESLLAAIRMYSLELWDCRDWTRLAEAHTDFRWWPLTSVDFRPKSERIVITSWADQVALWSGWSPNSMSTALRQTSSWSTDGNPKLAISADGSVFATCTKSEVAIRNPETGEKLATHSHKKANQVGPIQFSPSDSRVVFTNAKEIESWPTSFSESDTVIRYVGHTANATTLHYTPDGRTLISASSDGTVRLWEASTGLEKRCFDMKIGKIAAADVSPDGAVAAVGGANGEIVVWDLE